jgi:alpha-L-fucosidase
VQYRERIPVAEYAKLSGQFHADRFDADRIDATAKQTQMRYITITTRHDDSFCLFRTNQTDFSLLNSPAKPDLIAEMAKACDRHGLGLCLYYSHGRDWKHPTHRTTTNGVEMRGPTIIRQIRLTPTTRIATSSATWIS